MTGRAADDRRSTATRRALVRLGLTLGWAGLILLLTLLPGEKGSLVGRTSAFFGGTDLSDAIGHAVLFGVLSLLGFHAGRTVLPARPALLLTLAFALALGTLSEILQLYVPERGVTLFDMAANWIGAASAAFWLRFLWRGEGWAEARSASR
ncbi:MAG: VanZ family protein [Anaerolineae bacterium]|nr:VanZ family protein [Anaerolineae bacterium]